MEITKITPGMPEVLSLKAEMEQLLTVPVVDVNSFAMIDSGRKRLKEMRVNIQKIGKKAREEYIAAQKEIIRQENELVGVIDPLEKQLKEKQDAYLAELEKRKRLLTLPDRRAKIDSIEVLANDETLLSMDDQQFEAFYLQEKGIYIAKKEKEAEDKRLAEERELQRERDRLEAERRKLEEEQRLQKAREEAAEKQRLLDLAKAEVDKERIIKEREEAARKAEADKQEALEAERLKAEREKQELIDKRNTEIAAEQARKNKEIADVKAEEARKAQEQKVIEKRKEYNDWILSIGYDSKSPDYRMEKTDTEIIIFKKLGSFNYKI